MIDTTNNNDHLALPFGRRENEAVHVSLPRAGFTTPLAHFVTLLLLFIHAGTPSPTSSAFPKNPTSSRKLEGPKARAVGAPKRGQPGDLLAKSGARTDGSLVGMITGSTSKWTRRGSTTVPGRKGYF